MRLRSHIPAHYAPLIGVAAAQAQLDDWWSERVIRSAVEAGALLVAEESGTLAGVLQIAADAQPPTVYKLYVHPDRRGRGLAPRLLEAAIAGLPDDTARLAVEHFAANARAGAFYEREGFAIDRVVDAASGDPALAVVWRVKTLR